ncbi:hypothetical protein BJ165DRAFT_1409402 [Panaeolus papilionaceus]|nr:hypothetical protein BJ165DRAFT_1409402 [Panaeolus papilionaceus]
MCSVSGLVLLSRCLSCGAAHVQSSVQARSRLGGQTPLEFVLSWSANPKYFSAFEYMTIIPFILPPQIYPMLYTVDHPFMAIKNNLERMTVEWKKKWSRVAVAAVISDEAEGVLPGPSSSVFQYVEWDWSSSTTMKRSNFAAHHHQWHQAIIHRTTEFICHVLATEIVTNGRLRMTHRSNPVDYHSYRTSYVIGAHRSAGATSPVVVNVLW